MLAHFIRKHSAYGAALAIFAVLIAACGASKPQVTPPAATTTSGAATQAQDIPATEPSGPAPTEPASAAGSSISDPAPVGSEVAVDDMTISVIEVVAPADDIVGQANSSNPTPAPSTHYVMPKISVTCNLATASSCSLTGFEFSLIDSTGVGHSPEIFLTGVPGLFESGRFSGGATTEGYLPFIAPEGDQGLILIYKPVFGSGAYLALQ